MAYSDDERRERVALGLPAGSSARPGSLAKSARACLSLRVVHAPDVLNEATAYAQPVSFSRGVAFDLIAPARHVLLSGTASIGANGETLYAGDFCAQCWRTYRNLTRLLESEGASWRDVVRCRCYLRDIERDYEDLNDVRTEFFTALAFRGDPIGIASGFSGVGSSARKGRLRTEMGGA